jgi:hypothetical protein
MGTLPCFYFAYAGRELFCALQIVYRQTEIPYQIPPVNRNRIFHIPLLTP